MRTLRIALAQINCCVGDLAGNRDRILDGIRAAKAAGAQIAVFPELAVTGYPPEDLLLKPQFIVDGMSTLQEIAAAVEGICAIVGFAQRTGDTYNAAAVIAEAKVAAVYHKRLLPNYGVFDEARYFERGDGNAIFTLGDAAFGVTICEDIWRPGGPAEEQVAAGAQLLINISASPYYMAKGEERERMLATRAADHVAYFAYCNMVGGQDELVFDGHSVIYGPEGHLVARGKQFGEDLVVADLDLTAVTRARLKNPRGREPEQDDDEGEVARIVLGGEVTSPVEHVAATVAPVLDEADEVWAALCTGLRDYVRKNGFARVVLGLSGGVDSAIVACIAADALGSESVTCVFMPSEFSSQASREDAGALAANLGVDYRAIPISGTFAAYKDMLAEPFAGRAEDITEENLQARIRGNILMALSNKFGWLVLTTGNKSEMACGYATLYGDMAGGFAVLKDVPKTLVYRLARRVDERVGRTVMPERIITRPPTAELKPDQTDQDTLPPYEILDPILDAYIDEDMAPKDIAALGYDPEMVLRVVRMVDRSEYKRRQAPPGVKITTRAFGRDRRLPITNRYKG